MSNGLLNGLVSYYKMLDESDALNLLPLTNQNGVTFAPGVLAGEGVATAVAGNQRLKTSTNALLHNWGDVDWLMSFWITVDPSLSNSIVVGENTNSGWDFSAQPLGAVDRFFAEVPWTDNSYSPFIGPFDVPAASQHQVQVWYTVADTKLHLMVDGTNEQTVSNVLGNNVSDVTNIITFDPGNMGSVGLWKTTIPDAAGRALLFAGTPFSQFDSGGGGGIVTPYISPDIETWNGGAGVAPVLISKYGKSMKPNYKKIR